MRLATTVATAILLLAAEAGRARDIEPYAEAIVDVRVNDAADTATLVVRLDEDGALLIRAVDLATLRLRTPDSTPVVIGGEAFHRFAGDGDVAVNYDSATQSVELSLPASAFVATRTEGASRPPVPQPTVTTGAFLNYDFSHEDADSGDSSGAFVEGGLFGLHGVVTGTGLARSDREERSVVRLDTTWTRDFPAQLASLRAGDTITSTGAWGRAARIGGIQFATNYSTQPTLVTTPLLSAQGEALVPSTVDVFVNGQRVANEAVPPGPFAIDNLPAISGAGQMQVVVTDALGRQQVISQPFYSASALLQAGLDEYSLEIGAIREDYTTESFRYGQLAAAGTWRRGLSNTLTGEGHFETSEDGTYAVGLDSAAQLGRFGVLSATLATGGDAEGDGWLGAIGFQRSGERLSLFASTQWTSERFAQLGSATLTDRPRQRSVGGIGLDLRDRGSLQFAYGVQDFWNARRAENFGLSYSLSLGAHGFLSLFANHNRANDDQTSAQLSWTMSLGERRSVSASIRNVPDGRGGDELEAVAGLQQNLPVGAGSGYQISASSSSDYALSYAYQGRAGQANVAAASRDGAEGWRVGALGGLAITRAGVMPSRTLERSFAVVKVADYADIPVYVENQLVAHTDRHGRVLLEDLRPYDANEIRIDPNALPMDASLSTPSLNVVPAYRSGALLAFPVRRAAPVTFRLRQSDGSPVPAGAMVRTASESVPVANDGLVYLEKGEEAQQASAEWLGGHCWFRFDRGTDPEPIPDLGEITCHADDP
jgi:outer membrane usher protein